MAKVKQSKGRGVTIVENNPKVAERVQGAATVGASKIVVDNVTPVSQTEDALNIPSFIPEVEKSDINGFVSTVTTNKQDRGIDRGVASYDYQSTEEFGQVSDRDPFSVNNNNSVASFPTAINLRPLHFNEYFKDVIISKHSAISSSAMINMLHDILFSTIDKNASVTPVVVENNITSSHPLYACVFNNNHLLKAEYFTVDITNGVTLTANDIDASVTSVDTDAYFQSCVTYQSTMRKLQAYYHEYPGLVHFGTGLNGGILCYHIGNLVYFVLPVTTAGTQGFDSSTWTYSPHIHGDKLAETEPGFNKYYEVKFGDKIQEIAACTPGLYAYSNANIAFAKAAVKFKEMAIARNDTINPCYTMSQVFLEAALRRNTMIAANAAIAIRQISALQGIANIAKVFWPAWSSTIGTEILSRKEEIDAHIAAIQTNLGEVRVKKAIFNDLVRMHDISMSPMKTEGQLKIIVPKNACFPVTEFVEAVITNTMDGGVGYSDHSNIGAFDMLMTSSVKTYDTSGANDYTKVVDMLLDYLKSVNLSLKEDAILTVSSGTSCYTVLSDAGYVPRAALKARPSIINRFNSKPMTYMSAKATEPFLTQNAGSNTSYNNLFISSQTLTDGRNINVIKMKLPSTDLSISFSTGSQMGVDILNVDQGYVTGRKVVYENRNAGGIWARAEDKVHYSNRAVASPEIMKLYSSVKTSGNNQPADYHQLSLAGIQTYIGGRTNMQFKGTDEFILYYNDQFLLSAWDPTGPVEPYAAFFNTTYYNRNLYWYGVTPATTGEYKVVDIPTIKDVRVGSLCAMNAYTTTIHAFNNYWASTSYSFLAGAPSACLSCGKTKIYLNAKAVLSGFGLVMPSHFEVINWGNLGNYRNTIPTSGALDISDAVLIPDYSLGGIMRSYSASNFDTEKYQFAAFNSTLYLLD